MEYKGKLYGKVGVKYFPMVQTADDVDKLTEALKKAKTVIGQLKRSMLVHPDCVEDSEFDGFTDAAQECEDQINEALENFKMPKS